MRAHPTASRPDLHNEIFNLIFNMYLVSFSMEIFSLSLSKYVGHHGQLQGCRRMVGCIEGMYCACQWFVGYV